MTESLLFLAVGFGLGFRNGWGFGSHAARLTGVVETAWI